MKQVDKMPTSGQFVAVWVYDGLPWSSSLKWGDDLGLYKYSEYEDGDGWTRISPQSLAVNQIDGSVSNVMFFTL